VVINSITVKKIENGDKFSGLGSYYHITGMIIGFGIAFLSNLVLLLNIAFEAAVVSQYCSSKNSV